MTCSLDFSYKKKALCARTEVRLLESPHLSDEIVVHIEPDMSTNSLLAACGEDVVIFTHC